MCERASRCVCVECMCVHTFLWLCGHCLQFSHDCDAAAVAPLLLLLSSGFSVLFLVFLVLGSVVFGVT